MLAVYPVTQKTAPILDLTEKVWTKLGPNASHNLLVVTCPDVAEEAQAFTEKVKNLFADADVLVLPVSVPDTIKDKNRMYKSAAHWVADRETPEVWLWLDNAWPTQRAWLNTIQEEYNTYGQPFLGAVEKTFFHRRDNETGKDFPDQFYQQGDHMRCGVFPPDYFNQSNLMDYLTSSHELALQNEIAPNAHHSTKIATMWASKNFALDEDGLVIGEKTYESDVREVIPVDLDEVALLHGCRDASLGELIADKKISGPRVPLSDKEHEKVLNASKERESKLKDEIVTLNEKIEALRESYQKRIEELTEQLAKAVESISKKPAAKKVAKKKAKTKRPARSNSTTKTA